MEIGAFDATPQGQTAVLDRQRQMNGGRAIPPKLKILEEAAERGSVFIYNVGPWQHKQWMGSLGIKIIPKCEEGQPYSKPLKVSGVVDELYPANEAKYERMMYDGMEVASQIIGVGKHLAPQNSLVKLGVFISRTEIPSEEDLAEARKKLAQSMQEYVNEASAAMAQGPKVAEETIRHDPHFLAARYLNKTAAECPWLARSVEVGERKTCEGCGTTYKVGVIVCGTCGFILDEEKYTKNKARFSKK